MEKELNFKLSRELLYKGLELLENSTNKKNILLAIEYIKLSSQYEFIFASPYLAYFYIEGIGVKEDIEKAMNLVKPGMDQGNPLCSVIYASALLKTKNKMNAKEAKEILWKITFKHSKNCPEAFAYLGKMYFYKFGVSKSYVRARKLCNTAIITSNHQYHLMSFVFGIMGSIYLNGLGVLKNTLEAIKYFEIGVNYNDIKCLEELGKIYLGGEEEDVTEDHQKAIEYLKIAEELGSKRALVYMGDAYSEGKGVEKNHETAIRYYESYLNIFYQRQSEEFIGLNFAKLNKAEKIQTYQKITLLTNPNSFQVVNIARKLLKLVQ